MPKVYGYVEHGSADKQEFWDQPKPTPGPADLLIAVHAAGVNPADWKIREGWMGQGALPAVLGLEASGVVEEVGKDVEGFVVGDQVFGSTAPESGGFAEYTLLTAEYSAKKPPQVSFADAATLPVAARTAYNGIHQFGFHDGQTLLVLGVGGGVGVVAAQLARDSGVTVLGTGSEGKRSLAESLDVIFVDYHQDVVAQVRAVMPDGVDGIFDLVGGDAARQAGALLKPGGTFISAADPGPAGEFGGTMVERDAGTKTLTEIAALVAEGKLNPHAVDLLPLDQAAEALAGVESGHSRGKVVITVR
jgi:NADPH:quinone reductase-like Zn-dependent oxidoreductase